MPGHVAIVMDGNGRWAQQHGLTRTEGHQAGVKAVKASVRACLDWCIPMLSLFAFSSENWSRPKDEVTALMHLFFEALSNEVEALADAEVRLIFTGNKEQFAPELQQLMLLAEKETALNTKLCLNVCINYGGQWDIVQAIQQIAAKVESKQLSSKQITADVVNAHLATYPLPSPDLLIRTSGEHRISNFFLWQAAYTELYFTETLWPDFDEKTFKQAVQNYQNRERRFGLIRQETGQ